MAKEKQVKVELIDPEEKPQLEPYRLMAEIRKKYHSDTIQAKIALAWKLDTKPDADGHIVLGQCHRASDLEKEFSEWDFVITLNAETWGDKEFDAAKKKALLDHELCHVAQAVDGDGEQVVDSRSRKVWRLRKHDIEEFQSVVAHHGCYKKDLESFAEALLDKHSRPLFEATEGKTAAVAIN
jgi:hypothetical protein